MLERVIIAGSGGQGIVLIGRLLATVAVQNVPHVTFFPAYGAEVRGGVSNCHVVLSSEEIASPLSERFDTLIIMNQESLAVYQGMLVPGGLGIVNSSLCKASKIPSAVAIPATEIANDLGDTRVANFIMLGAYVARKPLVQPAQVESAIREFLAGKSEDLVALNTKAFHAGLFHADGVK
jgi:2-oxoglutarate ferredoxin oxidoreductase subunit gamma